MRTILITALLIAVMRALSFAQGTPFVGTCDQYQPGPGGDFCMNNGSATFWVPFSGDISNTRNTPTCSATNSTGCGKLTVQGINGVPINGTLTDGQTFCFHAADNTMIPCAP